MSVLSMLFSVLLVLLFCAALVFGFFLWINSRDAGREEASYDSSFDPSKSISRQSKNHVEPDEPDPTEALKHYRVQMREPRGPSDKRKKREKRPE